MRFRAQGYLAFWARSDREGPMQLAVETRAGRRLSSTVALTREWRYIEVELAPALFRGRGAPEPEAGEDAIAKIVIADDAVGGGARAERTILLNSVNDNFYSARKFFKLSCLPPGETSDVGVRQPPLLNNSRRPVKVGRCGLDIDLFWWWTQLRNRSCFHSINLRVRKLRG